MSNALPSEIVLEEASEDDFKMVIPLIVLCATQVADRDEPSTNPICPIMKERDDESLGLQRHLVLELGLLLQW